MFTKGVKDYEANECTLDLTKDFLNKILLWHGKIKQAWRIGKVLKERDRTIKVVLARTHDKHDLLTKK